MEIIKLKILVDNNAKEGFKKEHGFSIWIEAFNHKIIVDTGQGKALLHNAERLNCNLSEADTLILTHGHYDHCSAISDVLKHNSSIHIYCHPEALVPRYSFHSKSGPKVVSVQPKEAEALFSTPINRMHWVTSPIRIENRIGITGTIPRLHAFEDTGGPFYLDSDGRRPDPINDDIALWTKTERGLIIVTGCCHAGLINTIEYIFRISGSQRILGIIGGFHLLNASPDRLDVTILSLKEWNPEFIIPCHCTGDKGIALMQKELDEKVMPGYAGLEWETKKDES